MNDAGIEESAIGRPRAATRVGAVHWLFGLAASLAVHAAVLHGLKNPPLDEQGAPDPPRLALSFAALPPEPVVPPEIEPVEPEAPEPEPEPEPEPVETPKPVVVPEPAVQKPEPKPKSKPKPKPKSKPKPKPPQPRPDEQPPVSRPPPAAAAPVMPRTEVDPEQRRERLAAYYAALGRQIARAKRYPRLAMMRRQQGTVKLRLRIAADGSLLGAEIATPSKYRALNDAALKLARDASPFPKPPAGAEVPLEILVPVRYTLR